MFLAFLVLQTARDIVIADFELDNYGKWTVVGTAFGDKPARGTLPNQMPVYDYRGRGLANSYYGGDGSTGSLTSPTFKISRRYINFLIGGGRHPNLACINLIVGGRVVRSSTGESTTPEDKEALCWASWDVSKLAGKKAQIQILDQATGGWGHINIDDIILSDTAVAAVKPESVMNQKPYTPPKPEPLYRERFRPQFHFSAKKNWLNDPNGLVYYDGEYHLFFQHNPSGIQWGNMTWGHAVSPDLVHWKELPTAIHPDELGTIYSGSAALDVHNTTGFGTAAKPPLVAMYTAAGKPFTQCLVYSNDRGRTWTKYAGNPVLKHVAGENRDPRIFYHEPTKKWIMALYLDGDEFAIYGSPDLKSWKELSRLRLPGSSECPELFEIPLQGTNETRWIFYGANFRSLVGTFDGTTFTKEDGPMVGDAGANFYASQTYSNTPDGRRIQIGWMNGGGPMPNMPFNQQMSFPCELKLVNTHDGMALTRTPVKEIESLRGRHVSTANVTLAPDIPTPIDLKGRAYDLSCSFVPDNNAQVVIQIGEVEIVMDAERKELLCMGRATPFSMRDGRLELRVLVDRSSLEIFAQGGLVSMTSYLPTPYVGDLPVRVFARNGSVRVEKIDGYELKSAWRK